MRLEDRAQFRPPTLPGLRALELRVGHAQTIGDNAVRGPHVPPRRAALLPRSRPHMASGLPTPATVAPIAAPGPRGNTAEVVASGVGPSETSCLNDRARPFWR